MGSSLAIGGTTVTTLLVEVTIRRFHDCITLGFADAESCTSCAAALRSFAFALTTRAGAVKPVVIIRSGPPPVEGRGRGLDPFNQVP